MFKKTVNWLVIAMVISLIGITVVQFIWIKNTWTESQKLVENRLQKSLNEVDQKLSDLRYLEVITHDIINMGNKDSVSVFVMGDHEPKFDFPDTARMEMKIVQHSSDASFFTDEEDVSIVREYNNGSEFVSTIVGVSDDSSKFHINDFITRITHEFEWMNTTDEFNVDSVSVDETISAKLANNDLKEPFTWTIKDNKKDSIVYGIEESGNLTIKKELFTGDIMEPGRFELSLNYPISSLLWKKTGGMITLSFFFTLIIVLVFILAVRQVKKHKKISQIKSDFLNNLTHELKTPLASISLASDTLTHESVISKPEKVKDYAGLIKQEKNKLTNHVERILELAALEKNKIEILSEGISLQENVKNTIRDFELIAKSKNLLVQFEESTDYMIQADLRFLPSVIGNILDNAIKYSNDGGKINLKIGEENNSIVLEVKDDGIGMSKNQVRHSFDSFYRAETGNIHNTKGFGIGLSFVKQVMDLFGGEVSIESELGKETTVKLKFKKA